jgi:kynureninase
VDLKAARKEFETDGIYVNTASIGLPPRSAVAALDAAIETWRSGRAEAADYDGVIERARRHFAELVGVTPDRVAIGNQVSTFSSLVAAALPDCAHVVAAEEDFTSVLFPFLAHADHGIRVETVPLSRLVEAIRGGVNLVAVSAVQSADGRLVPDGLDRLSDAAARHGCLTYVDATQAVGWLPLRADMFDFVSCAAYKWLLSPRGTAFGVVRPEHLAMLRPLYAGWYAGDNPWTSIYGPPLRLAKDARRLDISPDVVFVGGNGAGTGAPRGRRNRHYPSPRSRSRQCPPRAPRSAGRRFRDRDRRERRSSGAPARSADQSGGSRRRGAPVLPSPQHGRRRRRRRARARRLTPRC